MTILRKYELGSIGRPPGPLMGLVEVMAVCRRWQPHKGEHRPFAVHARGVTQGHHVLGTATGRVYVGQGDQRPDPGSQRYSEGLPGEHAPPAVDERTSTGDAAPGKHDGAGRLTPAIRDVCPARPRNSRRRQEHRTGKRPLSSKAKVRQSRQDLGRCGTAN